VSVLFICCGVKVILCLTYNYGDGSFYVGEVDEQGRPDGPGKFYNTSGKLEYNGEFFEGVPHGVGTWYGADGSMYDGKFVYGRSSGQATMIMANGDHVEGEFLDMKAHGNVVMTSSSTTKNRNKQRTIQKPEAEVEDGGTPSSTGNGGGRGQIVRVEGQFRHGMAHGKLTLWYKDPFFIRKLKEVPEGVGPDGSLPPTSSARIDATFRMGLPHGTVKISDPNGGEPMGEVKFLCGRPLLNEGSPAIKQRRTDTLARVVQVLKHTKILI